MPRTNMDGRSIRRVLEWLCDRDINDADMADALGVSAPTYSRRKDADDFPTFEELDRLATHFGVSPRVLQICFGLIGPDVLLLLDDAEMRQFLLQGGGNHPHFPLEVVVHHPLKAPMGKGNDPPRRRKLSPLTPRQAVPGL